MKSSIFVTGTNTGVGKTVVTGLLARMCAEKGIRVVTQKWVQTGCPTGISEDITIHEKLMGTTMLNAERYTADRAPYVLSFPSSPHLAATMDNVRIDVERIEMSHKRLAADFDIVIAEGSGGIFVPLNDKKLIVDIAMSLNLKVLIVAENRLGAINQTLLTVEALRKRRIEILGIVFNRTDKNEETLILNDNKRIIGALTGELILGELDYNEDNDPETFYDMFRPIGERIIKKLGNSK